LWKAVRLHYRVYLQRSDPVRFKAEDQLRDKFARLWRDVYGSKAWLALTDEETPTFELSIDDARCFAIRGQLGEITTIMGTALPSLSIAEKDLRLAMIRLIRILEHLARYEMFKELVNNDVVTGELSELVSVTVGPAPKSKMFKKEPLEPVSSMQLNETEGLYDVEEKRLFRLTVCNRLDRKVHFALPTALLNLPLKRCILSVIHTRH
jgi:hypothetical protein